MARPLRTLRTLSTLIGPPDPISHLRPVIYSSPAPRSSAPGSSSSLNHPYSLREFAGNAADTDEFDLHFRLQRAALDKFNHEFWTDSNTRFLEGKQTALDSLPPSATPKQKEDILSNFYTAWLEQESTRQIAYSRELRRRNLEVILLETRVTWRRFRARLGL